MFWFFDRLIKQTMRRDSPLLVRFHNLFPNNHIGFIYLFFLGRESIFFFF